jgi:hypothetical protein
LSNSRYVFASCDELYFKEHGKHFIESVLKNGDKPWVNICAPFYEWDRIASTYKNTKFVLSRSICASDSDRIKFACSRFEVASDILNTVEELLITDIDCFQRKPVNGKISKTAIILYFSESPCPAPWDGKKSARA